MTKIHLQPNPKLAPKRKWVSIGDVDALAEPLGLGGAHISDHINPNGFCCKTSSFHDASNTPCVFVLAPTRSAALRVTHAALLEMKRGQR